MEDLSNYEKLRQDAQKFYSQIGHAFSPVFSQNICFNAEGFNHIILKGSRKERERPSQILRFKLLSLATKLIGLSTTYQEFEETIKDFEIKSHKKRVHKTIPVRYWWYRYCFWNNEKIIQKGNI